MLIVKVCGGLGNQMFQYAFYEYLKNAGNEVYLDISDFKTHHHHHGFELKNIFGIDFSMAAASQIRKVAFNHNALLYRGLKKAGITVSKQGEFEEITPGIKVSARKYNRDLYFTGFWQSPVYCNTIADLIREKYVFLPELSSRNKMILELIQSTNSVSVHIRRGDYVGHSSFGNICTENYYKHAIRQMNSIVPNCKFFVFSDDMEWVARYIALPDDAVFVDWNTGTDSYVDMQLMSSCKHNIIANSTFSWWGAWLNANEQKTVIMPKTWNNTLSFNPLLVEGWITI